MCDYSLQGLPNRLAVDGEALVTHRFITGSMGMASVCELDAQTKPQPVAGMRGWWKSFKDWLVPDASAASVTAVCLAPGTRLLMREVPPSLAREFRLNPMEEVVFTQINAEAFQFRDALQFSGGRRVLLQHVREGLRLEVLSTSIDNEDNGSLARLKATRERQAHAGDSRAWSR